MDSVAIAVRSLLLLPIWVGRIGERAKHLEEREEEKVGEMGQHGN